MESRVDQLDFLEATQSTVVWHSVRRVHHRCRHIVLSRPIESGLLGLEQSFSGNVIHFVIKKNEFSNVID